MQGTGAGPPTPAARTLTSARRALTTVPSSASTMTVTSRGNIFKHLQKYLQVATSVRTALARPPLGRPVCFLSNGQGKVLQYLELVRAAVSQDVV